jgi:hypothetical protein
LEYYRGLPSSAFDMAATYNKPKTLGMMNIYNPGVGPLVGIDSLSFYMYSPVNDPTLEIYSIKLSKDDPGDLVLQEGYLVDSFGQWAAVEWPGKVKSKEELIAAWKQESELLEPLNSNISQYGGFKAMQLKATGFFRTEKVDGKWWFVDPEGYPFLSMGVNGIGASVGTRTKGREYIFENLQDTAGYANYYGRNIKLRYGDNVDSEWMQTTFKRMHAWGLNTMSSAPNLTRENKIPFVGFLFGLISRDAIMGLADIYDSNYAETIDKVIREATANNKDNPWLLGYFVGNEQPWPGQEELLCNRILEGNDSPIKKALQVYLKKNGDSPETKCNFVLETFDKFLALINSTLKKHDPNHLNLGMRFGAETSNELLAITGKHFDVFSFNCYRIKPLEEFIARIDSMTGLPCLIGEFHFGVPDRGLHSGLVQVYNFEDRGKAYRYYSEQGYSHPSLIGAHWFQWIDEANTGRMDGENYNIGMIDITDRPYQPLVEAIKQTHESVFDIHRGIAPPTTDIPQYALQ